MQLSEEIFSDGEVYTPGICIFCKNPFDEESSGGYNYAHKACVDKADQDFAARSNAELISRMPSGTRFDTI